MRHIWSVICSKSIIDKETNNISLIEVIERVRVELKTEQEDAKVLPLSFQVVSLWVRTDRDRPERGFGRVVVKSPEGERLTSDTPEFEANLQDHQRFRSVMRFLGLPFAGNGIYQFIVQSRDPETDEWKDEVTVPLEIINEYTPEPIEDSQVT